MFHFSERSAWSTCLVIFFIHVRLKSGVWKKVSFLTSCVPGFFYSVSASRTVGREFASRPGHTKDHHKNGTNYLPA